MKKDVSQDPTYLHIPILNRGLIRHTHLVGLLLPDGLRQTKLVATVMALVFHVIYCAIVGAVYGSEKPKKFFAYNLRLVRPQTSRNRTPAHAKEVVSTDLNHRVDWGAAVHGARPLSANPHF